MAPEHMALPAAFLCLCWFSACDRAAPQPQAPRPTPAAIATDRVNKTDAQWRSELTEQQYRITRQKATERAFTGDYWNTKTRGVYRCVNCDQPLFHSEAKFDSPTGRPSFHSPYGVDTVATEPDTSGDMIRTEALCRRCGAHLGHVFDGGPQPTGRRYCVNSASLKLDADE